ncbi:MAG: hypothetical protein GXP40_11725 [Chloroflexi bacterium]|nr:hypothetical protein [Chloroflexota bacterium]
MKRTLPALLALLLAVLACGSPAPTPSPDDGAAQWTPFSVGNFSVELPAWPQTKSSDEQAIHNLSDGAATVWVKTWPYIPRLVADNVSKWAEGNKKATLLSEDVTPRKARLEFTLANTLNTMRLSTLLLYCDAQSYEVTLGALEKDFESYHDIVERIAASASCNTTDRPPQLTSGALGMVILPASTESDSFDPTAYQQALALARKSGVQVSHYYLQWGDIEKSPRVYDWTVTDYVFEAQSLEGFQVSVVVNVIHTTVRGRIPSDLAGLPFDDPRFVERLDAFLAAFAGRYAGRIHYLSIGNEVNNYFAAHPDEVQAYAAAFDQARQTVRAVDPGLPVGIVFAYHDAETSGTLDIVRTLNRGDFIAFTLYLYNEGFHFTRDPALIGEYMDRMLDLAGGTPVAIVETGWSTAPELDGSEQGQAEYVRQVFAALAERRERIRFVSWFVLHDSRRETCEDNALTFFEPGTEPDPAAMDAFVTFICYFGLRRADGTPKPGWDVWVQQAREYYP